jgi:hypothetical protein
MSAKQEPNILFCMPNRINCILVVSPMSRTAKHQCDLRSNAVVLDGHATIIG